MWRRPQDFVEDDPDDDKFIECAVALKADFVVTGDKALLAVEDYMGIKITTPLGLRIPSRMT